MSVANNYVEALQIHRLGYKPIKGPAIVFAKVGGAIFLERKREAENFLIDNNMMAFMPVSDFCFGFAKHVFSRTRLSRFAQVGALPSYNAGDLKIIKVALPGEPEQVKISNFLDVAAARLSLLTQRHEALRAYKKGMMQRLFSQELRFTRDDGSPFPDWQVKRLMEVAARVTEKNASDAVSFVLTNSAVEGIVSQQTYFDKDIANQENLGGYYVVQENDFVYNPRISVSAPVGPIKRSRFKIGVMSPLYTVFRFQGQNLEFFEQFFASSMWFKYLKTVANYGARHDRMAITTSDFMAMPLPYPHPDEQQKIADFLAALDAKIDAVARQIDAMQRFKKGLLQQMFV
jgi:type I restriction enzyme S subunit